MSHRYGEKDVAITGIGRTEIGRKQMVAPLSLTVAAIRGAG